MIATVHIYYTVEFIADGGQGFAPTITRLATFEYRHEALEYIAKHRNDDDFIWGYMEIREHIER